VPSYRTLVSQYFVNVTIRKKAPYNSSAYFPTTRPTTKTPAPHHHQDRRKPGTPYPFPALMLSPSLFDSVRSRAALDPLGCNHITTCGCWVAGAKTAFVAVGAGPRACPLSVGARRAVPSEKSNGHDTSCPYRGGGRHIECAEPLTPGPSGELRPVCHPSVENAGLRSGARGAGLSRSRRAIRELHLRVGGGGRVMFGQPIGKKVHGNYRIDRTYRIDRNRMPDRQCSA